MAGITAPRVRLWRQGLLDGGVGGSTVAKAYRLLRAVLNTAVDDDIIGRNPCRLKGAGNEPTPERPVISVETVYAIASAMPDCYRTLVLLAAFGSLRWGELLDCAARTSTWRDRPSGSSDRWSRSAAHSLLSNPRRGPASGPCRCRWRLRSRCGSTWISSPSPDLRGAYSPDRTGQRRAGATSPRSGTWGAGVSWVRRCRRISLPRPAAHGQHWPRRQGRARGS